MTQKFLLVCASLFTYFCTRAELVELTKLNPSFVLDIRYATTNNFTGKKVYKGSRCFLQEPAAKALDAVQKELEKQDLGLKIWDGYRPLSAQKLLWTMCPDTRYVANPKFGSRHNRGCAVDCTLIKLKTHKELKMPSKVDDLTERAHRNYSRMKPLARKNCKLLEDVMSKYGFRGGKHEWWHYEFVGIDAKKGHEVWRQYPVSDTIIE